MRMGVRWHASSISVSEAEMDNACLQWWVVIFCWYFLDSTNSLRMHNPMPVVHQWKTQETCAALGLCCPPIRRHDDQSVWDYTMTVCFSLQERLPSLVSRASSAVLPSRVNRSTLSPSRHSISRTMSIDLPTRENSFNFVSVHCWRVDASTTTYIPSYFGTPNT